jgi:Ca-activated chloride channel family protein
MKEDIIIAGEKKRQYVGDKLFVKYDGSWTQEGFEEYKGLEVHIKSFSDAYFHLFSRDFWIADVLKLGDKVRFIYEGYKIITGDDGMETVDELPEVLR